MVIKTLSSPVYFSLSMVVTLILIVPWPGTIMPLMATAFFVIAQSKLFGHYFFPAKELLLQFVFGLLTLASFISLVGTLFFYFFDLSSFSVRILTVLLPFMLLLPWRHSYNVIQQPKSKPNAKNRVIAFVTSILYLILVATIIHLVTQASTFEAIRSPWEVLPKSIFILYFLATLTIIYANLVANDFKIILNGLHFFVSLGLVVLVYPLGYGFDPFIHQATEKIILESGTVLPKPFYYIGHYSLVVWLLSFTKLSIKLVDSWLQPIITSLTLPSIIYYTFKYNFRASNPAVRLLPLFFLLIPFSTLIQSTPQALSFLWALIIIFSSLFYINKQGVSIIWLLFLAITATAIHPLAGVSLIFFILLLGLYTSHWSNVGLKRSLSISFYWLLTAVATIIIPLIFLIGSRWLNNKVIFNFTASKLLTLDIFSLHYYRFIRWEDLVYFLNVNYIFLMVITAQAALAFIIYKKKTKYFLHYMITSAIVLINYFLLVNFIQFDFLIDAERQIFAARILTLFLFTLLPFVFLSGYFILHKITKSPVALQFLAWPLLALLVTANWYMSYPRFDYYQQNKGFNVSLYDKESVTWIDKQAAGQNYVVLANQSVAAAAIEAYGFAHYYNGLFYYPVPTGDILYQSYLDLVEQRKDINLVIDDVRSLTGQKQVYVIINDYWHNFDALVENLKAAATRTTVIGDGKNYIFSFTQ